VSATELAEPGEVPDFAEPIEAWRAWRVVAGEDGYRLGSVVRATLWPPGEALVAECLRTSALIAWFRRKRRTPPPVPDAGCECGIYASGLPIVGQYLNQPAVNGPDGKVARVLGQVSLWGRVIECERGFRASHAYPLRIYVPLDSCRHMDHRWEELVAGLDVYQVPVELLPARCSDAIRMLEQKQLASLHRADT
jgi:hypothetical protein